MHGSSPSSSIQIQDYERITRLLKMKKALDQAEESLGSDILLARNTSKVPSLIYERMQMTADLLIWRHWAIRRTDPARRAAELRGIRKFHRERRRIFSQSERSLLFSRLADNAGVAMAGGAQ